ncbi:hypothetical protein OE09_2313 [Flavobacteriaceae bacterium MAR_2010_72]|nr:hypothetical protein OE09_2313 [Flavobacteriaceae bacterium MAR_2010_72]
MKVIFSFIIFMVASNACDENVSKNIPDTFIQESPDISISYKATTRGFYKKIWITKDSLYMTMDRNSQHIKSQATDIVFWNELISLIHKTSLEQLEQLDAPSKMHQVDGAALATLEVKRNQKVFTTKVFDHGHPPKAISTLVNKVLSVKEILAKQ